MSNPTIEDRLEWTLADNVRQAMEISRLSSEVYPTFRAGWMAGSGYDLDIEDARYEAVCKDEFDEWQAPVSEGHE